MVVPDPTRAPIPGDLYPETKEELAALTSWCLDAWIAARGAREPHEPRWDAYDLHWEAFIKKDKSDWRSKVYMPEVFTQVETIKPKLIASLPSFLARPVGKEDIEVADLMSELLDWSVKSSKLHLELAKVIHPTLLYGTGILKTFPDTVYAFGSEMVPIFRTETQLVRQPLIDPETQRQLTDPDTKEPLFNEEPVSLQVPVGYEPRKKRYVSYDGPSARAVNIRNFWPAPEAEDVQTARYVIHRTYKNLSEIKKLVAQGTYRWPDDMSEADLFSSHDDPRIVALGNLDLSPGNDPTRKQIEMLEIWTNDGVGSPGRVITLANRRAILRVHENPFWHGQKPFIRFVDYLRPHHFWGVGEVQAMEGIADAINAITNQRIDAGRLTLDPMWAVNEQHLVSRSDIRTRPGGAIRIREVGLRPSEVIEPINRGGVPQNAFQEVATLQQMGERTTAVSSYQRGDAPMGSDTATAAAILSDAGTSRFSLKQKLFEIDPFADLALHYGSMLQQFTTTERVVRLVGEEGINWQQVDPSSLQGNLDYDIEPVSSQQSETMKRQQALDVFTQVAQAAQLLPPGVVLAAFKDLLEAMDAKQVIKALEQAQAQQAQMAQMQLPPGLEQTLPEEMPPEQMPEQPIA